LLQARSLFNLPPIDGKEKSMTKTYILLLFSTASLLAISFKQKAFAQQNENTKPKISFSFDDGSTNDFGAYKLKTWNQLLLNSLKKHNLKVILFSTGHNKENARGKYVLSSWNDAGHSIGNHTYSHPNFNSKTVSLAKFESEFIHNDTIINKYSNYCRYFRFPYLKEGDTPEKVNGFRQFLKEHQYKNGHVTIDASDWYIDSRLVKRLKENPQADISGFNDYYKNHLLNRALFYDSIAYQLTNRHIHHVLLLHHNLAAALFLDDLITYFEANGWEVEDTNKAYQDKIYDEVPNTIPAGESLIWALANQSGQFKKVLRYPAEDGEYEKPLMDKLGL
jgi:peptidoglycan/xylan/chitin deacetylase (PgdA/CDA1 family)